MSGAMRDRGRAQTPIRPEAYTEEYYRSSVEGHAEFAASGGRELSPRMVRALALAGLKRGQRVLDIACGRGEVVLQAALRGADAFGIDYAAAALHVARESLASEGRTTLARMDATRLAFAAASFDAAFMLDFVEHVYQPDLEASLREVQRVLKPGGRLVIHTSPNRVFERGLYRNYVIKVHETILNTAKDWLRLEEGLILNELTLPIQPHPLLSAYELELHVNPQDGLSLRRALEESGFRVRKVAHYQPPAPPFFPRRLYWHNALMKVLDVVRFFYPFGRLPPLNQFFSNHIWVVAERR
jgi:2-polyprenyl-3-methyl-5-hydroxy-6-metoxy-1,4-benzoquinol methylase